MDKERIGIFGGTFSPVHNGHIRAALAFFEKIKLDKLYIVPTFVPPHKSVAYDDDPMMRYEMLRLAFKEHPLFEKKIFISDFEIKSKAKSYTYLTLRHFKKDDNSLFFLCGTDMYITLDTWKNAPEIFRLSTIVHALREKEPDIETISEFKEKFKNEFGAETLSIRYKPLEISSTEIRNSVKSGKDISEYVPKDVELFIKQNGLYIQ